MVQDGFGKEGLAQTGAALDRPGGPLSSWRKTAKREQHTADPREHWAAEAIVPFSKLYLPWIMAQDSISQWLQVC